MFFSCNKQRQLTPIFYEKFKDETAPETASIDPMELTRQESQSITQALEQTRWNKTAAAKLLGLSLRQLRYRLQKLDIE